MPSPNERPNQSQPNDSSPLKKTEDAQPASLKTKIRRLLQSTPIHSFLEQRSIRRWYESKRNSVQSIEQAIESIESRWHLQPTEDKERPVFIFASGWRSGSTLLQRLVNSDPTLLLWGEPFPDSNIVQRMATSLQPFQSNYPPDANFIQSDHFATNDTPLSKRWTANLYPSMSALFQAHRVFWQTLYAEPAKLQQCSRWGFKDVRLNIEHAMYLKWLFPNAKFLFLYRNPYHAYRSCYDWRNLYWQWPDKGISTPTLFGQCWAKQVYGFLTQYHKVDGYLVKYEDLCTRKDVIEGIASYLDADIDASILDSKIGSSKRNREAPRHLVHQLKKAVNPLAESLGYRVNR
jgi:hypothetical protein